MSVQKIETVKKSRKDQGTCSKCRCALPAGTGYLYWMPGFRSNYKIVRCLKPSCFPKPSERETSKIASILAAQENFAEVIDDACDVEEAETAVREVGTALREVADEYQEALDAWEHGNEQLQEKVDHYSAQADELEDWSYEGEQEKEHCEFYEDEEHDESDESCDCEEKALQWLDDLRAGARDAVDNVDFA